ncbi:MAG: hypothetical protein U0270_20035 [Labilithrix sp.]
MPLVDDVEEDVGGIVAVREVADLVDDQHARMRVVRAPAHRDRTKRRIAITRFAPSRSHKTAHRDHPFRVIAIAGLLSG